MSEFRGCGGEEIPYAPKPEARDDRREECPHTRGQGRQPRGATHAGGQGWRLGGTIPRPHAPAPKARGGSQEELPPRPHAPTPKARGGDERSYPAMAAWAQEGLEELSHIEGQEGRR